MRYPVGYRKTWQQALWAAREASKMTRIRYAVVKTYHEQPNTNVWAFFPRHAQDEQHTPVRV